MRVWMLVAVFMCLGTMPTCSQDPPQAGKPRAGVSGEIKVRVRPAAVAGQWYPGDEVELRTMVRKFIATAEATPRPQLPKKPLLALISAHAGYVYSGATAAHGYALLRKGDYDTVVILGNAHYAHFHGASIADVDCYETPLGRVPLDTEAVSRLRQEPLFQCLPAAHRREHSIEAQLPFLQERLGTFRLVPILFGELTPKECELVAQSIRRCISARSLFVASTDFTHYGAAFGYVPFRDNVRDKLRELNAEAVARIAQRDFEGFHEHLRRTGNTICGHVPVSVLMKLLPEGAEGRELAYATSSDQTGDWSHVVVYVSLGFFGGSNTTPTASADGLSPQEKQLLLTLARQTLTAVVRGEKPPAPPEAALPPPFARNGEPLLR